MTNVRTEGPIASAPAYRPLGAFRLALALVVVAGHSAWILQGNRLGVGIETLRGGSSAVLAFFLLSGFVLSEATAWFYAGRPGAFVKNRALKILPTFAVALTLSIAVHAVAAANGVLAQGVRFEGIATPGDDLFGAANLAVNLVSFLPSPIGDGLKKLLDADRYIFVRYVWAVRVEVLFYLILAFAIWVGARRPAWRRYGLALTWFALLAAGADHILGVTKDGQFAAYFIVGVCLFWQTRDRRFRWPTAGAFALGAFHAYAFLGASPVALAGLATFVALSAWLCLASITDVRLQTLDRKLGDLSYSLYLNHYAVLVGFSAFLPSMRGVASWALVLAAALGVALATHLVVERPLMALRRRIRRAALVAPSPTLADPADALPAGPAETTVPR